LVLPAKTDMTANLVSEATPAKLVPGAQSVLPVNLALLVSLATLDPLAPSADPVSVGQLAPAGLLAQVDPPVRWDLLGRPAHVVLLAHAVFLDQLVLQAHRAKLASGGNPSRPPN